MIQKVTTYLGVSVLAVFLASAGVDAADTIESGAQVQFDYTLSVDGEVVESSDGQEPLEYTHGQNMIIPGLEAEMDGKAPGDSFSVTISPDQAYGPVQEDAFRELPLDSFPEDFEPQQGMILELKGADESIIPAVVWEVREDTVLLNFNHPLAGKTLQFDVEVVSVQ